MKFIVINFKSIHHHDNQIYYISLWINKEEEKVNKNKKNIYLFETKLKVSTIKSFVLFIKNRLSFKFFLSSFFSVYQSVLKSQNNFIEEF